VRLIRYWMPHPRSIKVLLTGRVRSRAFNVPVQLRFPQAPSLKLSTVMRRRLFAAISAFVILTLADTRVADAQTYRVINTRGPVSVSCGAYQRPVVHYVWSGGYRHERVTCVNRGYVRGRPVRHYVYVRRHRPWQTTAAVIGGSTAAGAGIGAIAGGRKGAAIGALVGGGAGTAYEVHKRHQYRHRYRRVVRYYR
jgi:hypothetical protein